MGKIFLGLVLLLGAALYFPQTRPVVVDTFAPVINPVLRWQTQGEMQQVIRELAGIQRVGRQPLPTPGEDFASWMERNFYGGGSLDGWGNPYTMQVWRDSVGVVSWGPDLEFATPDDIVLVLSIPRDNRRGRR